MSYPYSTRYYPPMPAVEVALGAPELGRNVLNQWDLRLDGPNETVTVLAS